MTQLKPKIYFEGFSQEKLSQYRSYQPLMMRLFLYMFHAVQDFAYIEIDLSSFEKGACIEFGYSEERSESQFRIILGGWNGTKSIITEYNSETKTNLVEFNRNHSKIQWKNMRCETEFISE